MIDSLLRKLQFDESSYLRCPCSALLRELHMRHRPYRRRCSSNAVGGKCIRRDTFSTHFSTASKYQEVFGPDPAGGNLLPGTIKRRACPQLSIPPFFSPRSFRRTRYCCRGNNQTRRTRVNQQLPPCAKRRRTWKGYHPVCPRQPVDRLERGRLNHSLLFRSRCFSPRRDRIPNQQNSCSKDANSRGGVCVHLHPRAGTP